MNHCISICSINSERTEIVKTLHSYQEVYGEYDHTVKKSAKLSENEQQMAHRLDLIQFQWQEIQEG